MNVLKLFHSKYESVFSQCMFDIHRKIGELTGEHDCVVLPGLGAFVSRGLNAQVDLERNFFSPPTRAISFNKSITKDDGLLSNEVAHAYGISHSEAAERVAEFIDAVKADLNDKGIFTFEDFGVLRKKENGIAFTPLHPKESDLGLPSFYLKPLIRDIKEAENIDNVTVTNKEPMLWRRIAIALLILPFALYIFWIVAFSGILSNDQNINLSSLNPIRIPEKGASYEARWVQPVKAETEDIEKAITTEEIPVENPVKIPSKKNYFLVVGCFRDEFNAQSFVSELTMEGFDAEIFDQKNGLYRVSLAAYENEKDARKMLSNIQGAYKDAWLYRRL